MFYKIAPHSGFNVPQTWKDKRFCYTVKHKWDSPFIRLRVDSDLALKTLGPDWYSIIRDNLDFYFDIESKVYFYIK